LAISLPRKALPPPSAKAARLSTAALPPVTAEGREPGPGESAGPTGGGRRNLMTFAPDGARGVVAIIDGIKAASA